MLPTPRSCENNLCRSQAPANLLLLLPLPQSPPAHKHKKLELCIFWSPRKLVSHHTQNDGSADLEGPASRSFTLLSKISHLNEMLKYMHSRQAALNAYVSLANSVCKNHKTDWHVKAGLADFRRDKPTAVRLPPAGSTWRPIFQCSRWQSGRGLPACVESASWNIPACRASSTIGTTRQG